jgi:hypothetical protein
MADLNNLNNQTWNMRGSKLMTAITLQFDRLREYLGL